MIKSYYNDIILGGFDTIEKAMISITKHLKKNNIKNTYYRIWVDLNHTIVIDYGSWSNFYYIKGAS